MPKIRPIAFYPLLMGIYPVLALAAYNIAEIDPATILRPLVVSLVFAAALLAVTHTLIRDTHRVSAWVSLALILFFTYGHVYALLEGAEVAGSIVGRHRFLLPLWGALFLVGAWGIHRAPKLPLLTRALQVASLVLVLLPAYQIGSYTLRAGLAAKQMENAPTTSCYLKPSPGEPLRDVYFIVLDAYARGDVLCREYDFDNSDFLEALEQRGFYVAEGSQSNYGYTVMSLASTLNLSYLPELGVPLSGAAEVLSVLAPQLVRNQVRLQLECLGYKTIAFESGYRWTEWTDADIYLTRATSLVDRVNMFGGLSNFETLLFRSTLMLALTDSAQVLGDAMRGDSPTFDAYPPYHRQGVLYVLDELERIPEVKGPKLVFAHIVSPHAPYVFGPQGQEVTAEQLAHPSGAQEESSDPERIAYRNQVVYLNGRILQIVETILARSNPPPIILLEGDHGYIDEPRERLAILHALFLPGIEEESLYPTMTPVNSFRLVFDRYFGTQLGLLEDRAYYSFNPPSEGGFTEVANDWSGEEDRCR